MNRSALVALLLVPLLALAACDDGGPAAPATPEGVELALVVNSVDRTLTVFPTDDPAASRTIGLGPDGSPVAAAARGSLAVVPLGLVPAVAVVDLDAGAVVRTVALPEGSGATGAAFVDDSIALVGNPQLDSVTPVNVLRGTTGPEIPTGGFPQAIVVAGGRAFVLDAELGLDFLPARTGTVTVVDGATLTVVGHVDLSGFNPGGAALGPDGRLYVVESGSFGQGDGSLSVVSTATLAEVEHHPGFGEFPAAIAVGPAGHVFVSSFAYGIAEWDPASGAFVHPPTAALAPGGVPSTAGLGADAEGRLYALGPDCQGPATAYRLDAAGMVAREIPVGTCPIGISFTRAQAR